MKHNAFLRRPHTPKTLHLAEKMLLLQRLMWDVRMDWTGNMSRCARLYVCYEIVSDLEEEIGWAWCRVQYQKNFSRMAGKLAEVAWGKFEGRYLRELFEEGGYEDLDKWGLYSMQGKDLLPRLRSGWYRRMLRKYAKQQTWEECVDGFWGEDERREAL